MKKICSAEVTYSWQPIPLETGENKGAPPPKQPPPLPPKIEGVFSEKLVVRGEAEAALKEQIASRLANAKAEALNRCREEHENRANCLSQKLKQLSGDLPALDYASRKALLDSINFDCARQNGSCLAAAVGEITCADDTAAQEAAKEGAGGGDAKAAAGAKEKKK